MTDSSRAARPTVVVVGGGYGGIAVAKALDETSVVPNSDYLGGALASARRSDGFIEVGPTLQVAGQTTVFAVGDISTADSKMAGFASRQAATVAENINALAQGRSDLAPYESWGVAIAVPIGPTGGGWSVPRTGRDRRERDHRRDEGQGAGGRPIQRALRISSSGGSLTEPVNQ